MFEVFKLILNLNRRILIATLSITGNIGIQPTYPSEKYGYIIPQNSQETLYEKGFIPVSHFIEKPNHEDAKRLITEGTFWNGGVFAFKLGFLLDHLIKLNLPINFKEM